MRRRYVYRLNAMGDVEAREVTPDYQRHDERVPLYTDLFMNGHTAIDGTDIGSRPKRREYMNSRGLADASDFTNYWAKCRSEREAIRSGANQDNGQIRSSLERSWRSGR
jgi:hypothetical protein